MRAALLGALVGAAVMLVAAGAVDVSSEAYGQRPQPSFPSGELGLIAVPVETNPGGPLLAIIDPRQRVLSVYRIEAGTGKVALCSVRNIQWDLQMMHWNSENPLPQEIRSLLEQR